MALSMPMLANASFQYSTPSRTIAAVADRDGVLDVVDDGLLGRAHSELGVGLLEVPAVDVARVVLVGELAQVAVAGGEVADALVGLAGLVARRALDVADRVVEGLDLAPASGTRWRPRCSRGSLGLGDDLGEARVGRGRCRRRTSKPALPTSRSSMSITGCPLGPMQTMGTSSRTRSVKIWLDRVLGLLVARRARRPSRA
jgi:hypothetical protein